MHVQWWRDRPAGMRRRELLIGAGLLPALTALSRGPRAARGGDDAPRRERLFFTSRGETALVNADGSGLRRLTRNPAKLRWFAWSPDGRTIAFLRNGEVYIVNADGSGERRLTQLDG